MSDASRFESYRATVLDFGVFEVDLGRPLVEVRRAALARLLPEPSFAVITACNPGTLLDPAENERRTRLLAEELDAREAPLVPVLGCSPDREHREESFAVAIERAAAADMARDFDQEAIFWYDGERFWLVGALQEFEPIPLP